MRKKSKSPAPPKQKRLPPEDRRKEFIRKATEFFADEGFNGGTRELARRLDSGRPFTPRQCQVAAYLAWRYRRQISGRIVPGGPVAKP